MQLPSNSAASTVLLVTNHLEERPKGGRELLCKLNYDVLRELLGDDLGVFHLKPPLIKASGLGALVRDAIRGYIDGVDETSIADIVRFASALPQLQKIFLDGSNLGVLAAALKQQLPRVEIITFFHNVEARFFLGSLRTRGSVRAAGVLLANYVAERQAVRFSDKRICLNERDSHLLKMIYGRGATDISPMALKDRLPGGTAEGEGMKQESFALFVGGTFYANRVGIEWYVDNVASRTNVPLRIVGRGFEAMKERLEVCPNVQVVGEVDDLSAWYREARFVIAPIFDGSGMKTKVAEALMYGKKVVGTPEAFSGYERLLPQVGWVCASAPEFARTVNHAFETTSQGMDPQLRRIFVERYSQQAAQVRMAGILSAAPALGRRQELRRAA